jgi:hypothetical protein
MRAAVFRGLACVVAAVLAPSAMVLITLGMPWESVPLFAMCALFGGYAVFGEDRILWMFPLLFGLPTGAVKRKSP